MLVGVAWVLLICRVLLPCRDQDYLIPVEDEVVVEASHLLKEWKARLRLFYLVSTMAMFVVTSESFWNFKICSLFSFKVVDPGSDKVFYVHNFLGVLQGFFTNNFL